jgi:hypothetical protein
MECFISFSFKELGRWQFRRRPGGTGPFTIAGLVLRLGRDLALQCGAGPWCKLVRLVHATLPAARQLLCHLSPLRTILVAVSPR